MARFLALLVLPSLLGLSSSAFAQQTEPWMPQLGMDPAAPDSDPLPGGMTPSFGHAPTKESEWRFDFHGAFTAPLRVGFNTREEVRPDQSEGVLHTPPVVPDDEETFSHTGVTPQPYAQLAFSYGNPYVTATVTLVAKTSSVSAGFFDPAMQRGINDVFVTLNLPDIGKDMFFRANVGAFSNRYGMMGEFDNGRYGTPLIAQINGVGENIQGAFKFGNVALLVEQGIHGSSNKPGNGITPDGWNGFADQRVGSTFVTHWHAALSYKAMVTLGAHYVYAWSQDERASPYQPDGSIAVLAADLRLSLGRFGHFYAAYARTDAEHSVSVGRTIEILNAPGGPGLEQNYFGTLSGGTGTLDTIGGQYSLSIGRLVSYPVAFTPGPDVVVNLFALSTLVGSEDPRYDGFRKTKFGAEATYAFLPWLAGNLRYDRVAPDVDDDRYSFAVLSPALLFKTGYQSRDQISLQYSHYFNGSHTTVRTGYPPREDVTVYPDEDVLSLSASMWW